MDNFFMNNIITQVWISTRLIGSCKDFTYQLLILKAKKTSVEKYFSPDVGAALVCHDSAFHVSHRVQPKTKSC